jgi:hypothetical protein
VKRRGAGPTPCERGGPPRVRQIDRTGSAAKQAPDLVSRQPPADRWRSPDTRGRAMHHRSSAGGRAFVQTLPDRFSARGPRRSRPLTVTPARGLARPRRDGYPSKCEDPGWRRGHSRCSFRAVYPARPRHGERLTCCGGQPPVCPQIVQHPAAGGNPAGPVVLRAARGAWAGGGG